MKKAVACQPPVTLDTDVWRLGVGRQGLARQTVPYLVWLQTPTLYLIIPCSGCTRVSTQSSAIWRRSVDVVLNYRYRLVSPRLGTGLVRLSSGSGITIKPYPGSVCTVL